MVCRTAYLLRKPEIEELTGKDESVWIPKTKMWLSYFVPFLFTQYRVSFTYDYGFCCGVDSHSVIFQTREDAEQAIQDVYDNKHDWIKYNPEYMEDEEMSNDTG